MIIKAECPVCKNTDAKKFKHYDGALGYEAIYCRCCGTYSDHNGFHLRDESSEEFLIKSKYNEKELAVINFMESLVGKRFNEETLEAKLSEFLNEPINIVDTSREDDECTDYNYMFNCANQVYAYYDIYVLKHRQVGWDESTFYVTEVSYDFTDNFDDDMIH